MTDPSQQISIYPKYYRIWYNPIFGQIFSTCETNGIYFSDIIRAVTR